MESAPLPSVPSDPPSADIPHVELLGVKLAAVTESQCVQHIMNQVRERQGGWLITPNLEILRQSTTDPAVHDLLKEATLLVADGVTLIWASRVQGTPLPGRVCGSNLIFSLPEAAARDGRSIFFFGGNPGTAEATAEILSKMYPGLRIAGTYCPAFGFEKNEATVQEIAKTIEQARPDIVFVALSFPKGELLIRRIRHVLPQAWWVGVGVSFSFVCGDVPRAPKWVQRLGVEWVHRLCQEPKRLARRYLIDGIPFATGLLAKLSWKRVTVRQRIAPDRLTLQPETARRDGDSAGDLLR